MSSNWTARADRWIVEWSADEPHLQGTPEVVVAIMRRVQEDEALMVTPTGPSIPAELSSAEACAVATLQLYPQAEFTNGPDLTALWDDGTIPDDAVF